MSNELLSLPSSGGISLESLPSIGAVAGDTFQYDGAQWQIVANDNNNPLMLPGIVAPGAPAVDTGVLYKQTGSDGLWWRTDLVAPLDITLAAAATTDVPLGLNVYTVNLNIPAAGRNYHTIQAAITAAEADVLAVEKPIVLITKGVYAENLLISDNIVVKSMWGHRSDGSVSITGTITMNGGGVLEDLLLTKPVGLPLITKTAAANTANALIKNCQLVSADVGTIINYTDTTSTKRLSIVDCNIIGGANINFATGQTLIMGSCAGQFIINSSAVSDGAVQLNKCGGTVAVNMSGTPGALAHTAYIYDCEFDSAVNPVITSTGANNKIVLHNLHVVMPNTAVSAINISGAANQLITNDITFRPYGALPPCINVVVSHPTSSTIKLDGMPAESNTYMVNPDVPNVGRNYHTIQAAIDAAELYAIANPTLEQPVVLVVPGVYNEALTISRNIVLQGQGSSNLYNARSVVVDSLALGPCVTLNAPCTIKDIAFDRTGDAGSRVVLGAGWNIAVGDTSMFINCSIFGAAVNVAHTIDWSDATIANRSLTLKNTTVQATLNTSNAVLIGGTNFVYMLDGTFGRHSGVIQITSTVTFPLLMDKMDWNGRIHLNNGGGGASTLALLNSTLASNAAVSCIYDSSNFGTVQLQSTTVTAGIATPPINLTFGTNLTHDSMRVSTTLGREPVVSLPGTITQNDPTTLGRDLNVFTVNPALPRFNNNYHTIQAAINASSTPGGLTPQVILIAPGTYTEDLTIDRHVLLQGLGDITTSYQGDKQKAVVIIPASSTGHQITYTSSFKSIYFEKFDVNSTAIEISIANLKAVNFEDCLFAAPGTTAYLIGIDPAGAPYGSVHFNNCSTFGTIPENLLLNIGANMVVTWDSAQFVSGRIINEGILSLTRFGYWAYYGRINLTGFGGVTIKDSIITSGGGNSAIVSSAANASVNIFESTIASNDTKVIELSGVGSTLNYRNMRIRNIGGNDEVDVNGTVTNLNDATAGEDLNVYTVNPNRPLLGRNFHTIQAAINAAVATLPATTPPVVHVTAGSYAEPVLTISGDIILRGESRESVVFTGTTISCNSSCRIEDLTCDGVAASALEINVAIALSQLIAAKNCSFSNSGGLAPTVNWGVGSALCSFRPVECSFSSGSTGYTVLRLAFTNAMLATDCGWIGILENSNPNNNAFQLVRGSVSGSISLLNPYLPASGVAPVALGTHLHIIDYRMYSDNDTPAITSTMDYCRVISDNTDYLVNGVVAVDAIALTGVGNQLVECGTTFSTHPNRAPANVTRITVADNNVIHEDLPVTGVQLGVYTVNPNVPQGYRNFHTIQTAVTAAEAVLPDTGRDVATIQIATGEYLEDVTIAKRVELIGMGSGAKSYYQSAETGHVKIKGTVYANSPCVLENLIFNPSGAGVPLNLAINVGVWQKDAPLVAPYNEADSVTCTNCVFISSGDPGYCIRNRTDQINRTAGKRANVKLYECLQDNAGLFADLSFGNVLYMYRTSSTGAIIIDPIVGTTGNTSVLVAEDSTIQQLGAANPNISIAGTAQAAPISNVNILRCRLRNSDAGQIPISSTLNNVIVVLRSTEITTSNATAISLTGLATEISHYGLWSGTAGPAPALVAATNTLYNAIV